MKDAPAPAANAMKLRRTLNRRGSIFQSTSDTEVIIHLVATSNCTATLEKLTDALKQVEGAYSLLVLTEEGLIACRDPLGIRPLVMGKLGETTFFASETVALDVIGASFLREVLTGVYESDMGLWHTDAAAVYRYRRQLGADHVRVMANVTPEFASALGSRTPAERARSAVVSSMVDAVLVAGPRAGAPPELAVVREVKDAV